MSDAKAFAAIVRDFFARQIEPILARVVALEGRAPAPGPKGDRGEQGPAGPAVDFELIRLAAAEVLPSMVETAQAMLREHINAALPSLKGERGEPGVPGKDAEASDDYRDGIDPEKSYPRGTRVLYRGGTIVALRATDPLADDLTAAGWAVMMNGTHTDVEESLDEGRTVRRTLTMTNGKTTVSERKTSLVIYRGVWLHNREYSRGDMATRDGSVWHCEAETTTDEPGKTSAWKLAVKRGNHGRDAK